MGAPKRIGYIAAPRIWGNLNLGPGHWMVAPAGIIGAYNTMGDVYFVDWLNGNNGWSGTLPERDGVSLNGPWQTIAYAVTQITDDHDDYIIVINGGEPTPIIVGTVAAPATRLHIIGLSHNPGRLQVVMPATLDTDVFQIGVFSNEIEIAGFDIGGGATAHGIAQPANTCMGAYIHDCIFGSTWHGDAPLRGILIDRTTAMRIERCKFIGTGGNAHGTITESGIVVTANSTQLNGEIIDCVFLGCPGDAINAQGGYGVTIKDCIFACPDDVAGRAIDLWNAAEGYLVVGNKAMYGDVAGGMVNNPFQDQTAAGNNHWSGNMKGAGFTDPA